MLGAAHGRLVFCLHAPVRPVLSTAPPVPPAEEAKPAPAPSRPGSARAAERQGVGEGTLPLQGRAIADRTASVHHPLAELAPAELRLGQA